MDLNNVNLKQVLVSIKYQLECSKSVFIDAQLERIESDFKRSSIFDDELALIRILKNLVKQKNSKVNSLATKIQRMLNDQKITADSSIFKGISIKKVKSFIMENEFEKTKFGSLETIIGEQYYNRFLKK